MSFIGDKRWQQQQQGRAVSSTKEGKHKSRLKQPSILLAPTLLASSSSSSSSSSSILLSYLYRELD